MSKLEQKVEELSKRIDALQTSINTLTALVQAKLAMPKIPELPPLPPLPPMPMWPWAKPPTWPPYEITSKSEVK